MSEFVDNVEMEVPVECYSRVVGFFRPVSLWNKGKAEEWKDRVTYDVNKSLDRKAISK